MGLKTQTPLGSLRFALPMLLGLFGLTACDAGDLAGPPGPEAAEPLAPRIAAAPTAGGPTAPWTAPGVHFLDPIATPTVSPGAPDVTLLDLLEVEICAWSGDTCAPVRTFDADSEGPARLHLGDDGEYRTVWQTKNDAPGLYRVRVLASGGELAHADVEVVDPRGGGRGDETEWIRITRRSSLPVAFLIEEGVGLRTGAEGGRIELAGGAVVLDIPAGALPNDVFFTAVPTTVPPGDQPIVPGTTWDFGPDGLQFAQPVVMTIAYDPATLPPGVVESELRIHEWIDGIFVQQNAGLVDPVAGTVSAEVDGFSVFVVIPRDPRSLQDAAVPTVRAVEVQDASTGAFGPTTTLDVSANDASLVMRLSITDDVSGVRFIDVRFISPTGRQLRFPCYTGAPPTSGSDTNGQWECTSAFPRYAEPGVWQAQLVGATDRANNTTYYGQRPQGLCDNTGQCVTNPATVTVVSGNPDLTPPNLVSLEVSHLSTPRTFGPSVSVDASSGPVQVVVGLRANDDLSGLDNQLPFDAIDFDFRGPGGQYQRYYGNCQRVSGTALDGFFECRVTVPGQAEPGDWTITSIRVPDRAGNGGFSFYSYFLLDASTGQLCNQTGQCVTSPIVRVVGSGDGQAPSLQALAISAVGRDVTTSLDLTDDLSGVSFVRVRYSSTQTTQYQECFAPRSAGTPTAGTWDCTISFPDFAASGQWVLQLQVRDLAGNERWYYRRATDGFLCYYDQTTQAQICQDFGSTDIILN